MKHNISKSVAYKVSNPEKYSIRLLKELELQFPWLRWISGEKPSTKFTKESTYIVSVGLINSKLLYSSSGWIPSDVHIIIDYPGKTIKERIKEFKI